MVSFHGARRPLNTSMFRAARAVPGAKGSSAASEPSRRTGSGGAAQFSTAAICAATRPSSRAISNSADSGKLAGMSAGISPLPPKARSTIRSTAPASIESSSGASGWPSRSRLLAASGAIWPVRSSMVVRSAGAA
jgi:hypothetical protein